MDQDMILQRQEGLQQEADAVLQELKLWERLSEQGTPVRVGSSALGLMVWRDLDLTVICPALSLERLAPLYAALMQEEGVRQVRFRNDTGRFNTDPRYPDGLYLALDYEREEGKVWNVDIWFVDEPDQQPDLKHLRELPPLLTKKKRVAILRIKQEWAGRPEYRKTVTSYQIYDAVLHHGIETPEAFDRWRTVQAETNRS